jgi:hypothetical protein
LHAEVTLRNPRKLFRLVSGLGFSHAAKTTEKQTGFSPSAERKEAGVSTPAQTPPQKPRKQSTAQRANLAGPIKAKKTPPQYTAAMRRAPKPTRPPTTAIKIPSDKPTSQDQSKN